MPLTDTAVRNAKPTDKPQKLADTEGLYLSSLLLAVNFGVWTTALPGNGRP